MPSRNSQKTYFKNGYYHLYNRGVEKRIIFSDPQDYSVFIGYLKEYLSPKNLDELYKKLADKNSNWAEKEKILRSLRMNNFYQEIELLSYCLMPNHFHLLIKQRSEKAIDSFLNSLLTRYVMYFNKKNQRVGHLFQDVYKGVVVTSEGQLAHLSRYIHRNPLSLDKELSRKHQRAYTSLPEYLNERKTDWIKTDDVISTFSQTGKNSYQSFVNEFDDLEFLKDLIIENL
ncbi:MAG: hypothetical protein A2048_10810 [Deltaproteobacteria bacterium GWA2_45_12]|nr:MAG: hypothetical protein A2048_10810 [Deltaproteobacteria bacterium GWA2_45_12]